MGHEVWELDKPAYGQNVPAWHGLGVVVDGTMTSGEALEKASLAWHVDLERVFTAQGLQVPDTYVTVRQDLPVNDERRILGSVGNRYTPIQNRDAFALGDAIIGESGAQYDTAGSLKNGRVVWMLAKLPEPVKVKDDTLQHYLLLRTSHDGSSALTVNLTDIRVVCWNTLTAALGRGDEHQVRVRHTRNAKVRIDDARRVLGLATKHFREHTGRMTALAETPIDHRFVEAFAQTMYPDPDGENASPTRAQNARASIRALYGGRQAGANQRAISGTAYGLYNAFTAYLDHDASRPENSKRDTRKLDESRFESTLYGNNARKRQRGFDLLCRATGVDGQGSGLATQVLEREYHDDTSKDVDTLLSQLDV